MPYICKLLSISSVALVLASGCASSKREQLALENVRFESADWSYAGHPGRRITTEHYDIYTTLRDERLIEALPQAMETAFRYYSQLVPATRQPAQPMRVYLFSSRSDWASFTKRLTGPKAETLLKVRNGGYMERGVSVIEYVNHAITFPLVAHEGFHQYLFHHADPRVPAWLNEGLSVICEGQRWGNIGLKEFDAWHNPSRRNALAEALLRDELIPLDELLRINAAHVVGGSTRKISTYYAQLWALILFLQEGLDGKYAESFRQLLNSIGIGDLEAHARSAHVRSNQTQYNYGRALFCGFISDDLEQVQREYVDFMRREILGERR